MNKIINPCWTKDGSVFCEIKLKDGRLSISGVIGPQHNGNARGGCGQINMSFAEYCPETTRTYTKGWTPELFGRFLETWDRWHLNDMRPGCEHQRTWGTGEKITLTYYTWGPSFNALRLRVERAEATAEEYHTYQAMKARVYAVIVGGGPKYETPEVKDLLAGEWIKPEKTGTKTAGWVTPAEHPNGLLTKPCPVCGYKYGTAWLKEEVPPDVITFLESLPVSTIIPAWV